MASQKEAELPVISMADWLYQMLRKHAVDGKIAQIYAEDGTTKSYAELLHDSVRVAAGLSSMGLRSGDIASVVTRNFHNLFPLAMGCIMADITLSALVAELPVSDLRRSIGVVSPKVILTRQHNLPVIKEALEGGEMSPKPELYDIDVFFAEALSKGSETDVEAFRPAKIDDPKSHVFLVAMSSGTSGPAKGVMVTDYSFLSFVHRTSPFARKYPGPILGTSQIFWITWFYILLRALENGRARIFVDQISPIAIADAINKYKPHVWYGSITGVTPVQRALQENPGKWDFSSLKAAFCTGNELGASLHKSLEDTFQTKVVSEYGSTEMGVQFVTDLDAPTVYGSIGKPAFKVKLVDPETGSDVTEPFRPGELVTETCGMKGYVDNEKATKEAFDKDGWFKTGDMLFFDNDGNYFVFQRIKEMFKYRDHQVAPRDLENLIRKLPGVAEVVVVGKNADISIGQFPAAFVVKSNNSNLSEQDVHDFVEKAEVHDSKKLRGGVLFVEEIPKNANGKIVRRTLEDIVNSIRPA